MYCEKCGTKKSDDGNFCECCGSKLHIEANQKDEINDMDLKSKEYKQEGKKEQSKQWIYEFSYWSNPIILITTAKVLLIALMVPVLLVLFLSLTDGLIEALQIAGIIFGYGLIGILALLILAYISVGLIHGGKYIILFKMDEKGIDHIQFHSQVKKVEALGYLTALAGIASGNYSAVGAGLMSASRRQLHTSFKNVKKIKAIPSRNTIYLNETLSRNQIYPVKGELNQVLEYIVNHCPKDVLISK